MNCVIAAAVAAEREKKRTAEAAINEIKEKKSVSARAHEFRERRVMRDDELRQKQPPHGTS